MPEPPRRERDIIIEDETLAGGFTVVPNGVMRHPGLTPGAKLAYVMLLTYAWQDDCCFPGQATLARDMGASERYVRNALKELAERGLISIQQRGLNRTNLYTLHRPGPAPGAGPDRQGSPGPAPGAGQDRHETTHQDRHQVPTTNTQRTTTQETMETGPVQDLAETPEERLRRFEEREAELRRLRGASGLGKGSGR